MTPGARDVLMQALGLRPADKAVYDEAKLEQSNRQQDLTRTSGIMKQNLAMAIERGNMPQAQELIARARSWDQKNPSYSVLMGLASTLMQRAQARGMSGATGLPMGTNIRDQGAREVGDWARGLVGN